MTFSIEFQLNTNSDHTWICTILMYHRYILRRWERAKLQECFWLHDKWWGWLRDALNLKIHQIYLCNIHICMEIQEQILELFTYMFRRLLEAFGVGWVSSPIFVSISLAYNFMLSCHLDDIKITLIMIIMIAIMLMKW